MEELTSVAWHESGHAVIFTRLGIPVRSVRLGGMWNSDNAGSCRLATVPLDDPGVLRALLHGILAGPLSSGRTLRWQDGELIHRSEDAADAVAAAAVAGRLKITEPQFKVALGTTRVLLDRKDVIEQMCAVQEVLLRHGELEGADLRTIVEAAA